jgi:hypothetical protein
LGPDLGQVIALDIAAPDSLEEYDTLLPRARALDGRGDPVAVPVFWTTLDTAVLAVLDSTTGRTVVRRPGPTPGRLQARAGALISNPFAVRALAAADTLFAAGPTADTVSVATDSLSVPLVVELADTIAAAGGGDSLTVPLAGRPVIYAVLVPAPPGPVTLVTSDSARALVTADTVITGPAGTAAVRVRWLGPALPDSVVVTASAHRAVGTAVPGSPVIFVVRFAP